MPKERVGNIELEVVGEIEVDGKVYKIVNVPNADEFPGFPPSWEWVRKSMLTWRPFFKGKMVKVGEYEVPAVGDYLLNLDEDTYELVQRIYQTFKVNKAPIEVNVSVVVTDHIHELERKMGRPFTEEELSNLYIRYSVELAILRDVGLIN
ncbi:MAG: hypothetical protein ACP5HQ_01420 [Thermoprotei archaeon]